MRMVTGTLLIGVAEQAFSHAYLIGFPHQAYAQRISVPFAIVVGFIGVVVLAWGLMAERKKT